MHYEGGPHKKLGFVRAAAGLHCHAMLYFDHNATHPVSAVARQAWLEAVEKYPGNPSSPHRLGSRAEAALDGARERLAGWLGCRSEEIVWTSGATESNNMALRHLAAEETQGEVWISAIEHPSLLRTARFYFPHRVRTIPARPLGDVELEWLAENLRNTRPVFVALMAANNETGVLQSWREASALCEEAGVPFLCDAAQWVGRLPAAGLGTAAFVSGCAHKYGGTPGVGFLKCPEKTRALLLGGGQELGRRAGTENVPGILAGIAALADREERTDRETLLADRDDFISQLIHALPGARVLGDGAERLWNTVSAVMPEIDCRQRWVVKLDKLGAAVSTGSACASGREIPSHVLAALGLPSAEAARVLRFSGGWETRKADWQALLERVKQAAAELAAQAPLETSASSEKVTP